MNPYVHNLTGVFCPRSAFIEVVVACEQIAYWAHAIMQLIAKLRKVRGKLIPKFVRLTIPYLTSDKKWTAYALLMFLVALMLADTTIGVFLIWQTGEFTTALAERDADRFWKSTYLTIFLIAIGFPTFGLYYYVRDRLALHWRNWMTSSFMAKYFGQRNYYRISNSPSIDNPDQRIAEDINSFTSKSIYFLLIFIETTLQIIAFSGVLWILSPSLVWTLLIYASIGTLLTIFIFGRPLVALNFFQLRNEADFRFSLIRVRENAESIAFYRGEEKEMKYCGERFGEALANAKRLVNWQFSLNSFQSLYTSATVVIPTLILAPSVLRGEQDVGSIVQATGAFAKVFGALNVVVSKFDQLSYFTAGVGRLDRFSKGLHGASEDDVEERIHIETEETPTTEGSGFSNVTLQTPDGNRTLVEDLDLVIENGNRLLIVGVSGGGKSSLLRAFAGLWVSGSGKISRPELDKIQFLPQRPYMVIGTLRDQLLYPRNDLKLDEKQLVDVLETVQLPKLIEHAGGLDVSGDWSKTLSLGEQQRVAIARILLSDEQFFVLDEATSALDEENEADIYKRIADLNVTLISISHRPAVARFHTHVLSLNGDGGWTVMTVESYLESRRLKESTEANGT